MGLQVDSPKKPTFISKKRVFSEMKSKGRKGSLPSTPSTKTLKLKPATCLPSGEVGLCAGAAVMSTHVETAAVTRSDQKNEDRDAAVSPDDHTALRWQRTHDTAARLIKAQQNACKEVFKANVKSS